LRVAPHAEQAVIAAWDGESTRREAKPIPADSQVELTGDERQVLIRWIDLGAGF
jgi:hypothetical protein